MCEAGSQLVFDDEGSYVENKATGNGSVGQRAGIIRTFTLGTRGAGKMPFLSEAGSAGRRCPGLVRLEGIGRVGGIDANGDSEPAQQREAHRNAWAPFNPDAEEHTYANLPDWGH